MSFTVYLVLERGGRTLAKGNRSESSKIAVLAESHDNAIHNYSYPHANTEKLGRNLEQDSK